jgi:hypothetical protein
MGCIVADPLETHRRAHPFPRPWGAPMDQHHPQSQAVPDYAAARAVPPSELAAVTSELEARAFLHDDPVAYRAGVRDALSELAVRSHALKEHSTTG